MGLKKMVRKLIKPIRFRPETVDLLKKVKIRLKERYPKRKVTYDLVIVYMLERLGWN